MYDDDKITLGPFATISDVKAANRKAGFHWFDPDALRFFSSRISEQIYGGRLFISSEAFKSPHGDYPRAYTVRMVSDDGSVSTVGEFQGHRTLANARKEARAIIESLL